MSNYDRFELRQIQRDRILHVIHGMRPGQQIHLDRRDIGEAFSGEGLWEDRDPKKRLLSNLIGSAYGCFRLHEDLMRPDVWVISCHEGDERTYDEGYHYHVDSDREYLFDRVWHNGREMWKRNTVPFSSPYKDRATSSHTSPSNLSSTTDLSKSSEESPPRADFE